MSKPVMALPGRMDEGGDSMSPLAEEIIEALKKEPMLFGDILKKFRDHSYREILLAWSDVRETGHLDRTRPEGGYRWKQ